MNLEAQEENPEASLLEYLRVYVMKKLTIPGGVKRGGNTELGVTESLWCHERPWII